MRKLMFAAALATAIGMQAGAVESGIVGYQNIESPDGGAYKALVANFQDVTAGDDIAVTKLFVVSDPQGGFGAEDGADQIWRWQTSTSSWVKYFWSLVQDSWVKIDPLTEEPEEDPTVDTVKNGETIFFYRGDSGSVCTMTLSGAVRPFEAEATYDVVPAMYTFVGYPWPTNMKVSDMSKYMTDCASGFGPEDGVDQIWRWDTLTNDWIKYGVYAFDEGWHKVVDDEFEVDITDDEIPAGEGFFFYRGDSAELGQIVFTKE